ncbi:MULTISPECIES: FAD-dependent monooxygenase [Bacillaceae]|uniref:3-hydroxybenzoate 6-hydroxylase n=1 Tax=Domibacillus aminovorans TaxID=29332 RepID=A0A177KZE0_9BACI|nr:MULTISPECIES: FAD-dependent monooxygenase [Bacillaceae]OAH58537.1 3-hydroxybenzoate 6-hydroxylase [Domibacillus aminovorans]
MEHVSEVIVVGGGIGGLAAALGVVEAGKTVAVLEQAPQFGEVGAGIQLGPNAMAVLDRFGLVDEINKLAVFPKRLVLKDVYTGEELTALDLGEEFQERYAQPYIVMHRSDLHRVLLEACQRSNKITLFNDQAVQSAVENESGILVTNQRGETFAAEALIGADGLKSNMRKLFSDDEPICSEYVAYRGTIPINEISADNNLDDVIMWIGPNLHLVQYPVRRGELYNQVVVFKSFEYKEGSEDWGTPEEMDKRFEGCHPLVVNALSFIQRQIRWPMYDRLPIDNWTKGKITLLGDAAHPMLQYLAQGGCQALEDAACMADELLKNENDYETIFQNYQEQRIPRTAKVQTTARTWGEIIHAEDQLSLLLRDTIFKSREANDYSATDFLYGYHKSLVR